MFDHTLTQLDDIYNELDILPKTAELREALSLVSDLGTLLNHIQHD